MTRRPAQSGFTLIEMLVALALLALAMAVLAGSVRLSRSVLAAIDRNSAASARLPAQAYLRSALAATVPPSTTDTQTAPEPPLEGDATRLRFVTVHATRAQLQGAYVVEVGLSPSRSIAGQLDLVAEQRLLRPASDRAGSPDRQARRAVLAANVAGVTFAYFGATGDTPPAWRWFDAWSATARLPRLVRIELTFASGQGRPWRLDVPLQMAE